jgi:hypothetical protein
MRALLRQGLHFLGEQRPAMNRDQIVQQLAAARRIELDPAADKGTLRGHIVEPIGIVQMLLEELIEKRDRSSY